MAPFLEFEDKNVEKAVKKACKDLKIKEEKLKYDVISYGSTGIFGLVGVKPAKIRVTVPESRKEVTPKKAEAEKDVAEKAENELQAEVSEQTAPNESEENQISEENEVTSSGEGKEEEKREPPPTSLEENITLGENVLQTIIQRISEDAAISVDQNPERVLFNIKGGDSGVIIGKRGQTLEAIQYILDKVVNKGTDRRTRIELDVEGYLETRQTSLQSLAGRMSEKAKRTGKPVVLGQMNSYDRRIVHLALKDDEEVRTQSVGSGFYRKMVIYPKKRIPSKDGMKESSSIE